MKTIAETLKELGDKKAFIPYLTAGDPKLESTQKFLFALAKGGSSIIELGIPFSDPMADGPTIQKAMDRALKEVSSLDQVFNLVKNSREKGLNTPILLFSYLNPILQYGIEAFAKKARKSGAQGVLIVDLTPEEGKKIKYSFKKYDLEIIFLASPTTEEKRLSLIDELADPFIYYVSRAGVTGIGQEISSTLGSEIKKIKKIVKKPLMVGFGISNADQAKEVAQYADGVVIGSALVKIIEEGKDSKETAEKIFKFTKTITDTLNK